MIEKDGIEILFKYDVLLEIDSNVIKIILEEVVVKMFS